MSASFTRMVRGLWQWAKQTARLAIGIPDYDAYLSHMREHHPHQATMDHDCFHRERMAARYGKGRTRCC